MINREIFLITGASSGLGLAVANALIHNGHEVILVARNESKLKEICAKQPQQASYICGDLSQESFVRYMVSKLPENLSGAFINAGGPPAKTTAETTLEDWDNAYNLLIRWKVQLTRELIPLFQKQGYGRIVYSESTSVTRPVENLALSNSLRMAIVGLTRTLVNEYKNSGITFNVLAPGYHETKALERLYDKLSQQQSITVDKARELIAQKIPTGSTGDVLHYASLACWLLGSQSDFITGQVINVDGGVSI